MYHIMYSSPACREWVFAHVDQVENDVAAALDGADEAARKRDRKQGWYIRAARKPAMPAIGPRRLDAVIRGTRARRVGGARVRNPRVRKFDFFAPRLGCSV